MTFRSILFECFDAEEPAAFKDLNLDQIVAAVTLGREEYQLAPFFHAPLRSAELVAKRQDVVRELERAEVAQPVEEFARRMVSARVHLAQAGKRNHRLQRERWFLSAAEHYCTAAVELAATLADVELESEGLLAFRDYLTEYVGSAPFRSLSSATTELTEQLAGVHYRLHLKGNKITITRYDGSSDYSAEIEQTFARFQQGAAKDYRIPVQSSPDVNPVEAGILERVAKLYPDLFAAVTRFNDEYAGFVDPTVARFDRQVQFYLAYLDYLRPLKAAGLPFCYPELTGSKTIQATGAFDLALAAKLVDEAVEVVRNDFHLSGPERILVVTGPNQGGKTTFARTFGQLHQLAALGLPVPGEQARLFLFDRLFTHFEKEEYLHDLRGKLQDDLVRVHEILRAATGESIVILNEIFASTTVQDALSLGRRVLSEVAERDILCVCVTFVDELASLNDSTVSLVSTVEAGDHRTYKLVRKPPDGLAFAATIAAKYRLSYDLLKERLNR
ncbi:MutS-related protein [Kribbella sp. CA-253562]|uniref:MutS-related protein n=1 Tax=Kribbella sp. CA-253562 TaxID=3239942 RepID=UPI003D9102DE